MSWTLNGTTPRYASFPPSQPETLSPVAATALSAKATTGTRPRSSIRTRSPTENNPIAVTLSTRCATAVRRAGVPFGMRDMSSSPSADAPTAPPRPIAMSQRDPCANPRGSSAAKPSRSNTRLDDHAPMGTVTATGCKGWPYGPATIERGTLAARMAGKLAPLRGADTVDVPGVAASVPLIPCAARPARGPRASRPCSAARSCRRSARRAWWAGASARPRGARGGR